MAAISSVRYGNHDGPDSASPNSILSASARRSVTVRRLLGIDDLTVGLSADPVEIVAKV
jgi:hypothetical protein